MSAEVIKLADRRKHKHPEVDVMLLPLLIVAIHLGISVALFNAFAGLLADVKR